MYVHLKRNKYIILPFALVYTLSLVSQSIAIGSSLCQLQSLYNAHTQHKHLATLGIGLLPIKSVSLPRL